MEIRYTVNFYVNENEESCTIVIPALEYVVIPDIGKLTPANLVKYARREMEEIAFVMLKDCGEIPPDDESRADKDSTFSTVIEGNTDNAAKRVTIVKEFDVS